MTSAVPATIGIVVLVVLVIFVLTLLFKALRIVPQATAGIVERLGRYHKTLQPGLNVIVPFIDRVRPLIDMREQVVSFPPQPVITEDNLVVRIDTVVYFQVTDARAATYEIANYLGAVEQLTTTTLRNVVGGLNLEEALTSRDNINGQLRVVLDEATGKWGIRVGRVELKAIEPPISIQDSMEKQMRAERDRRAAILTAEGSKQSQILEAEGQRQSQILRAEGEAKAAVLTAQGESQAIQTVFDAIHAGNPDNKLLAYQYLQTLPKIAQGPASKLWVIPSELTEALKGIGGAFAPQNNPDAPETPSSERPATPDLLKDLPSTDELADPKNTSVEGADTSSVQSILDANPVPESDAANPHVSARPASDAPGNGAQPENAHGERFRRPSPEIPRDNGDQR